MDSRMVNYIPLVISAVAVLTIAIMSVKTGLVSLPFGKKTDVKSGSIKSVSHTKSSSSNSSESVSKDSV